MELQNVFFEEFIHKFVYICFLEVTFSTFRNVHKVFNDINKQAMKKKKSLKNQIFNGLLWASCILRVFILDGNSKHRTRHKETKSN